MRAAAGKSMLALLRASAQDFMEDHCPRMAAALAYYTIFSLPPLLILILMLVGAVWDAQTLRAAIEGQFSEMIGPDAARQIRGIIENANRPGGNGPLATLLGIAALVFGATGAFIQLQDALNRAWEVEPDPAQGGIRNFLLKRLFSFGMILGVAFLLLISLVVSASLSAFGEAAAGLLPGGLSAPALWLFNLSLSLLAVTLLFAALFKILPDAIIAWKDVWVGACATASLFVAGKFGIGMYLGRSDPGQAFGAAGSLAVLLLWVYYSGLILLFGAEFTQRWAESRGSGIVPEEGAVRVVEEKRRLRATGH
jgi:membrane protein